MEIGYYRHEYSGNLYYAPYVGMHTETGESHVIYMRPDLLEEERQIYVRPESMFTETIELYVDSNGEYVKPREAQEGEVYDTVTTPRFVFLGPCLKREHMPQEFLLSLREVYGIEVKKDALRKKYRARGGDFCSSLTEGWGETPEEAVSKLAWWLWVEKHPGFPTEDS